MKSMFPVDPQCQPSAVDLENEIHVNFENGMKIAQVKLGKEWCADAAIDPRVAPAVLLALDALLVKEDPGS